MSKRSLKVFTSPKHPIFRVNVTILDKLGFIQKLNIIQELLVKNDLFQKPLAHGYSVFHISLGQLMLYLNPVGIKFQSVNPNEPYKRIGDVKFVVPAWQRIAWTLTD